jgi:hypothetical protein
MLKIEIAGALRTGDTPLECPRCGGGYLHHGAVVIYYRHGESMRLDQAGEETSLIVCDGLEVSKQRWPSQWLNNPSRRRDGLAIEFDCEYCGDGVELTIEQHKGQTFLHWRIRPSSYTPDAGEESSPPEGGIEG